MSDEPDAGKTAVPAPTAQDALAFMQKMWNPFAMPMPGSTSGTVTPTDSPSTPTGASTPGEASDAPGAAFPGMLAFPNPATMFAALDPALVEQKIAELRVIEGWLAMSLDLMRMSIKTLELQRASLEALRAGTAVAKPKPPSKRKR